MIGGSVYFYGNSYTAGLGASPTSNRFSTLTAGMVGSTEGNRGLSGATAKEILQICLGQHPTPDDTWIMGTDSPLVIVLPALNTIRRHGNAYLTAFRHHVRGIVAALRAGRKIDHHFYRYDAGSWIDQNYAPAAGGVRGQSTNVGAEYSVPFTGSEVTVVGWVDGGQSLTVTYLIDGIVARTSAYDGMAYTDNSDGAANGLNGDNCTQTVERFTGLSSGAHVVTVRKTAGTGAIWADVTLTPATKPPRVLLLRDNPLNSWASDVAQRSKGSDAALAAHNTVTNQVAAEFGSDVYAGGSPAAWDKTIHLATDGVHPNNAGYQVLAESTISGIRQFDWTGFPGIGAVMYNGVLAGTEVNSGTFTKISSVPDQTIGPTTRIVEVCIWGAVQVDANSTSAQIQVTADGWTGGSTYLVPVATAGANGRVSFCFKFNYECAPGSISVAVNLRRAAGTGSVLVNASGIQVTDLGAA